MDQVSPQPSSQAQEGEERAQTASTQEVSISLQNKGERSELEDAGQEGIAQSGFNEGIRLWHKSFRQQSVPCEKEENLCSSQGCGPDGGGQLCEGPAMHPSLEEEDAAKPASNGRGRGKTRVQAKTPRQEGILC